MIVRKQWIFFVAMFAVVTIMSLSAFSRRRFKKNGRNEKTFVLKSPAFTHNGDIPAFYTCDDHNVSPALVWHNPPEGTQSFVLICHDPDALGGNWIHWIVYDIPAQTRELVEHVKVTSINAKAGLNSWNKEDYEGPCPPLKQHHYIFTLYALDIPNLNVKQPVDKKAIDVAMEDHILEKALLIGKYQRTKSI